MTDALKIRNEQKRKKPAFARQDVHKERRIARTGYRRPKGRQSKMRLAKKGYARTPSQGWRSPAAVRGLSHEGLRPVTVATLAALDALEPKRDGLVIGRRVGDRRREAILRRAKERKLTVLNLDVDATLAELEKVFTERKKEKQRKTIEQKAAAAEAKKADEQKADEQKADEQKADEQKADEQKADEQKADEKATPAPTGTPEEQKPTPKGANDDHAESADETKKREETAKQKVLTKKV